MKHNYFLCTTFIKQIIAHSIMKIIFILISGFIFRDYYAVKKITESALIKFLRRKNSVAFIGEQVACEKHFISKTICIHLAKNL